MIVLFFVLLFIGLICVFCVVRYCNTRLQKKSIRVLSSVCEEIIKRANVDDLSELVKNLSDTLSAPVVFLGEFASESQKVEFLVKRSNESVCEIVPVQIEGTSFEPNDEFKVCKAVNSDQTILGHLKITGRPYICTCKIMGEDNRIFGVLGIVYYKRNWDATLIANILTLYAKGVLAVLEHQNMNKNALLNAQYHSHMKKMESLGRLTSNYAHDFNNQLNAILGYGDLLYKKIPQEKQIIRFLDGVVASAQTAVKLNDKLMTFARKGKTITISCKVDDILNDLLEEIRQTLPVVDLKIETHFNAADGSVKGDPGILHTIFLNLITNAVEAMSHRGNLLIVTGNAEIKKKQLIGNQIPFIIPEGKYVAVSISDEGKGMDGETIAHLFEPLFSTKHTKDAGFGLSAVWGGLKNHNGYIDVSSTVGKGSTFTVYLPVYSAAS